MTPLAYRFLLIEGMAKNRGKSFKITDDSSIFTFHHDELTIHDLCWITFTNFVKEKRVWFVKGLKVIGFLYS